MTIQGPVSICLLSVCLGCTLLSTGVNSAEPPVQIVSQGPSKLSDSELSQALIGSWRIVDAHRDGQPSELHFSCVTLKHITPTQFTWLSYKPEDRQVFRSMGGSWEVRDGVYIETPRYGMAQGFRENSFGKPTRIEFQLDQDLFTQVITGKDGSKFVEVWERVQPGEDADRIPVRR